MLKKGKTPRSPWQHKNHNQFWAFFCPVCQVERRLRSKPSPVKMKHVVQVLLTTAVFGIALWPWCSWKGIFLFIPLWTIFEVVYRWKVRAQIPCPHCGFDAFIFLNDPKWAKKEMDEYWQPPLHPEPTSSPSLE